MRLNCEIVKDLVSIYKDGLASRQTARQVNEHLKHCPECRRYYRNYDKIAAEKMPVTSIVNDAYSEKFHELSIRLRKRHMLSSAAILGIVAASVCGTLLSVYKLREKDV